ncbi:hypothetical protein Peur_061671 [Populus x canadensis]
MTSALRFPWTQSMELLIFIIFSTFLLLSSPCHADSNSDLGSQCSEVDNATNSSEYQANLSELQNSLVANAPIQNGFYTTAAGKGANKIYGLTQCRGDISATDCAACIKNVTVVQGCSNSKNATFWFKWCFLRYSDRSFFGELDQSGMATYNETNFEDAKVVSEGLNFTKALASTTPNQPSMFYTAVLDAGQSGKRYGMAQCTRDLSKRDCGKCLDFLLVTSLNIIGNKRSWDIYGSSCSMCYYDYQFYFNYSTPAAKGGSTRSSSHRVAIGVAFPVLVFLVGDDDLSCSMDSGIRKSNIRNTQPILAVDIPDSGTTAEVEGIL